MKNLREWTWLQDTKNLHPIFTEQVRQQAQTHAGLWLDKYVCEEQQSLSEDDREQPRPQLIAQVAGLPIPENYPLFYELWEKTLHDYAAYTRIASTKGRMIVHLGAESVIETSIALHHTYGTPYIPGSSLKGLAASYLRQKQSIVAKGQGQGSQAYKELAAAYKILFGDQDEAGYIIFFDAHYKPGSASYQGQERPLHPDVMTVHHPKYYQGQLAPDDKQSPIPIPFLSATGCYLIALAAPDLQHDNLWIDFTFTLLAQALLEQGIGAKTSSGYGRLAIDGVPYIPPAPRTKPDADKKAPLSALPDDPLARQIEGYLRELKALPNNGSVNNQINSHYQRWKKFKDHPQGTNFARAIVEKVRRAGCEKNCHDKPWYKELLAVIG